MIQGPVLVLGGGGFLGSHVVRWLVRHGITTRVFDLHTPGAPPGDEAKGIEFLEGNFLNPSDLECALRGVEVVLHFVSTTVPATSVANVPVEIETNVAATVRLLDLMVRHGVRRIGFPSSGGTVYAAGPDLHREDEPLRPTCPYGLGKALIEQLLWFYRDHRGIEHQIWRIANPYGDVTKLHSAQGVIDAFLNHARAGRPLAIWGNGEAVRDFIFIDDVASAVGALLQDGPWNETVNIGSGRGSSIAQVIEVMQAEIPGPLTIERREGYTGPSRAVLDNHKLRQLTGWQPRYGLTAGIREAWRRLNAP